MKHEPRTPVRLLAETLYKNMAYGKLRYYSFVERVAKTLVRDYGKDPYLEELISICYLKEALFIGTQEEIVQKVLYKPEFRALLSLTQKPNESEDEYLEKVSCNMLSTKVYCTSLMVEAEQYINMRNWDLAIEKYQQIAKVAVKLQKRIDEK